MSRKIDFRSDGFTPVALALGQATLAWNDLQESLGELFWCVSGINNGMIPLAIWYSSRIDRGQREMLGALTELHAMGHVLSDSARAEIAWLLKSANSLEDARNNAIHTPITEADGEPLVGAHSFGHKRAKHLADKNLEREFRWLFDAAIVLRDYAVDLNEALLRQGVPLPERPKLPNRGDSIE